MAETVVIERRFRGPPLSGNGGYVAGLVASRMDGPAEVRLHRPPPLETPLAIEATPEGLVLRDGETLVASARRIEFEAHFAPPRVPLAALLEPAPRPESLFQSCFVCGKENAAGLGIFPSPVAEGVVAAPWTPGPEFARNGAVGPEIVTAALDCPGGFAWLGEVPFYLLGTLAVNVVAPVVPGEPHFAVGWRTGREGRRLYSGTAILDAAGCVCALGRAVWVVTSQPGASG